MTETPKFSIGMMGSGSLQKEVIFNEAIILLEALTARSVKSKSLTAPPASPANGDFYLITAATPTGAWANQSMNLALYYNGWRFIVPPSKMKVWVEAESLWYTFSAGSWTADAVSAVHSLDDLSDVVLGTPTDGQVLSYDIATHTWKPKTGSSVVNMDDLADVDATGLLDGQVLAFNSTSGKYEPYTIPELPTIVTYDHLSSLEDVDLSGLGDGNMLKWQSSSGKWVVGNPVMVSISDVNDVDTAGAQVGDALIWNGATWAASSAGLQTRFIHMVDGPQTFEGAAHKILRVDVTESELEYIDAVDLGILPTGGADGQLLSKTATGEAWIDPPSTLPTGGTEGQVLVMGATDPAWGAAPVSVPLGGTTGQVLTKASNADGDTTWAAPAAGGGAGIEPVGAWSAATSVKTDTFDGLTVPAEFTYYNQKGSAVTFVNDPDATVGSTYAFQFGDIDDSQSTYIEFTATADAANKDLVLRWRAETETSFDKLHIYVDGSEVTTLLGSGVGSSAWNTYTLALTAGTHTIRLSYIKNGSVSVGWDNFRFSKISYPIANPDGYVKGDVVSYAGAYWLSVADTNLSTPGTDANWLPFVPTGGTDGQILYRTATGFEWGDAPSGGSSVPAGGTTGQVLAKASNTDGDVAWVDQTGGSSGGGPVASVHRPTVVQSACASGGVGNAILPVNPTPGNLLVVIGSHWNTSFTPNTGWTSLYQTTGASTDGLFVYYKIAGPSDVANLQFTTNTGGLNAVLFEIADFDPLVPFDYRWGYQEVVGTTNTLGVVAQGDDELAIGFFSSTGSSVLPTLSGATATGTLTSTTGSGAPRAVTGFALNKDQGSATIGATWASSVTSCGYTMTIRPRVLQSAFVGAVADLTDVDLATAPTDKQVLSFDAAAAKWQAKDMDLINGGSVAHDYYAATVKLPVAADLPLVLTSANVVDATETKGNCLLVAGSAATAGTWLASGDGFMRVKAFAPGSTFEVIACLMPMNSFGHYDFNGIVLRDAVNDRNLVFGVSDYNNTTTCQAVRAKLNGFARSADNGYGAGFHRQPMWLRASASGDGNVTFSVSENGYIWYPQLTESLTAFLASVTHVGVGYATRMGVNNVYEAKRGMPLFYFHARTALGLALDGVPTQPGVSASATHAPMSIDLYAASTFIAAEVLFKRLTSIGFTLPVGLTGSAATLDVAPTNAISFAVKKNGVTVGTVEFAAGATTATFTMIAATSFGGGDVVSIVAPASADATASGFTLTLVGGY